MSVQIVSDKHVAAIVGYFAEHAMYTGDPELREIGQALVNLNVEAFNDRYDDVDHIPNAQPRKWSYNLNRARLLSRDISALQMISLCQNFASQVCDLRSWDSSKSREIVERTKNEAIVNLPGYDDVECSI